ncbi:MAG: DUF1289 domain-containing protein [Proteobacteria bacterium]|nr:DUF1289 domain-containing protein [Pseudomonadota bacterium]
MSEPEPASPCISVCVLNMDDICMGCYRSAEEVTDWFMASAQQKRDILQRAQQRAQAASSIRLS